MTSEQAGTMTYITNIQGYSIHDGPGIRTVVFFKGCKLNCMWCANPECISPHVQIGFIANLCKKCGKCFSVCPHGALNSDEATQRIDYGRCTACGECVRSCYYKALVQYGEQMRVAQVFDVVKRDKMFYDTSGGGVTVSGGEPLVHAAFVKALFELCKSAGINTCVETSGYIDSFALVDVLPVTDYVLFDLKLMDPDVHGKYTGHSNQFILKNARLAVKMGADILFRIPLIPTINDTNENIHATADFVRSITGNPRVQLMPYHRLGDSKYNALGLTNPLKDLSGMDAEKLQSVKHAFINLGVDCTISK